jgi:hypothetical protein
VITITPSSCGTFTAGQVGAQISAADGWPASGTVFKGTLTPASPTNDGRGGSCKLTIAANAVTDSLHQSNITFGMRVLSILLALITVTVLPIGQPIKLVGQLNIIFLYYRSFSKLRT